MDAPSLTPLDRAGADKLAAVATYCNGGLDDALRAGHAEAPAVRP